MRDAFIKGLSTLAEADKGIVLLTGDLGFKIFDDFARRFPGRFVNAGVAESNMIGVAAGLALDGFRPFAYSIAPFATLRCFEQIRNDVCHHNLPVTVVGVGGGYSYGTNGPTHHALEDIGAMRTLPNMTVLCPGDPVEAELSVRAIGSHTGPVYLRLGRAGDPVVHRDPPDFRIGRAITIQQGTDCTLISTGGILPVVVEASRRLREHSVQARVVSMHTVKPLDSATLEECCTGGDPVFTIEEHGPAGGLGSAIGEWLVERQIPCRLISITTREQFAHRSGSQSFLRAEDGLSGQQIAERVLATMERCFADR
jgi:transketolase